MEYTQWDLVLTSLFVAMCLNPCCNGIYSMSSFKGGRMTTAKVLILVVMEYTQWVLQEDVVSGQEVLILVVMEYTQWAHQKWC